MPLRHLYSALERRFEADILDILSKNLRITQIGTVVNATLLLVVSYGTVKNEVLYGWYIAMLVVALTRFVWWRDFRVASVQTAPEIRAWTQRFVLGTLMNAVIWGVAGVVLFNDSVVHQTFLAFVLGGISAGAVSTLSVMRPLAMAFVAIALLPFSVKLVSVSSAEHYAMAAMLLMYCVVLVGTARNLSQALHNSLRLNQENLSQRRENEEIALRLQTILDNTADAILTLDPDGHILSSNHTAKKMFKCDEESALVGRYLHELIAEPERSSWRGYFSNRTLPSMVGHEQSVSMLRASGQAFQVSVILTAMAYGEQQLYTVVMRDLTEREKIERLKRDIVSVVSHELRTPLTSIKGALDLINSGTLDSSPEKQHDMLKIAQRNAHRLEKLINDILDVEKFESGAVQLEQSVFSLNRLVRDALDENEVYACNMQVNFHLEAAGREDIMVRADERRIMQVLTNLLSNAAKFSPPGRRVDVLVTRIGTAARVEVVDRGAGIPEEFQPRIFQKFSQAVTADDRKLYGTGLGLNISKAIIEKHAGNIGFRTGSGGSTFFFDLPVVNPS